MEVDKREKKTEQIFNFCLYKYVGVMRYFNKYSYNI